MKLNPETQVVATLGSKEGFANMAQAITAPGDVHPGAEPDLSDPRVRLHHLGRRHPPLPMVGGTTDPEAEFLRGVERAVKHSIPKPLAVVLSYPSNPTAMTVGLDFYVEWCSSPRSSI